MLDGRVMRIDPERECVYIVRRGRSYEAPMSEVETAARVPSARVRFNIRRIKGIEQAENVKLRVGTRTSKTQRRFGDLTGARSPGSKVKTTAQKEFGIDVTTQPFRVAKEWVTAIGSRDFDGATSLYLPGAVIHTKDDDVSGRVKIRRLLEQPDWPDLAATTAELHGVDRYVRADAAAYDSADDEAPTDADVFPVFFEIESGQISEQWLGVEPAIEPEPEAPEVTMVTKGDVATRSINYGRKKVAALLDGQATAQMKLSWATNPTVTLPAMAEASVSPQGRTTVRVHTAAETMNEAIDLVVGRLKTSLRNQDQHNKHDSANRRRLSGTWRHGDRPTTESPYFDRPQAEREVVRHKSFAPDEMSLDEAAWDMSQLDYDFFLFVELTTGQDCLLEAAPDGDLLLHGLDVGEDRVSSEVVEFRHGGTTPPVLKPSAAIHFMESEGARFLFFENSESSRRNVLYRRYDGHYGLITPPADSVRSDDNAGIEDLRP